MHKKRVHERSRICLTGGYPAAQRNRIFMTILTPLTSCVYFLDIRFIAASHPHSHLQGMQMSKAKRAKMHIKAQIFAQHFPKQHFPKEGDKNRTRKYAK